MVEATLSSIFIADLKLQIKMKLTKLFLCFLAVCFSAGCLDDDSDSPIERRIINQSGFNALLKLTESGTSPPREFLIPNNDSLVFSGFCSPRPVQECNAGWSVGVATELTFDTLRIERRAEDCDLVLGPRRCIGAAAGQANSGYEKTREGDITIYTYVISADDFEQADPL